MFNIHHRYFHFQSRSTIFVFSSQTGKKVAIVKKWQLQQSNIYSDKCLHEQFGRQKTNKVPCAKPLCSITSRLSERLKRPLSIEQP